MGFYRCHIGNREGEVGTSPESQNYKSGIRRTDSTDSIAIRFGIVGDSAKQSNIYGVKFVRIGLVKFYTHDSHFDRHMRMKNHVGSNCVDIFSNSVIADCLHRGELQNLTQIEARL